MLKVRHALSPRQAPRGQSKHVADPGSTLSTQDMGSPGQAILYCGGGAQALSRGHSLPAPGFTRFRNRRINKTHFVLRIELLHLGL